MRKSPRERRLNADFRGVVELRSQSSILEFDAKGAPPEKYRFKFNGNGVALDSNGEVVTQREHIVIVELGAAYPRLVPNLAWQTPIFHPNISVGGVVCLGGYGTHWVPSLTLSELTIMLWDMIRFKNYDSESPYNREAAAWARENRSNFPLDRRPIRDQIKNPEAFSAEIVEAGIEVVPKKKDEEPQDIIFLD